MYWNTGHVADSRLIVVLFSCDGSNYICPWERAAPSKIVLWIFEATQFDVIISQGRRRPNSPSSSSPRPPVNSDWSNDLWPSQWPPQPTNNISPFLMATGETNRYMESFTSEHSVARKNNGIKGEVDLLPGSSRLERWCIPPGVEGRPPGRNCHDGWPVRAPVSP